MSADAIARSWLYVPAHKPRMIEKSLALPADAVIYDYEDAVPPAEKERAREVLAASLPPSPPPGSPRRYVRVNNPRHERLFADDLRAALALDVEGVVLPKMERAEQVRAASAALADAEREQGIEIGSTRLCLLVESPLGVVNAYAICSADPRIVAVQFGGEDFSREMGLPLVRTGEAKELVHQRAATATACVAAGVQPVDVIWTELGDLDGLAAEAAQARRLGYTGKAAIHPEQIAPINAAFSPTPEEIAYAREVIAALEEAVAQGTGVLNYRGAFLEEPVIARARRALALAERFGGG